MVKKSIVSLGKSHQAVVQYFKCYASVFEHDIAAISSLLQRKNIRKASYHSWPDANNQKVVWSLTLNDNSDIKTTIRELDDFKEERRLVSRAAALELLLLESDIHFSDNNMVFTSTSSSPILTQLRKFRKEKRFCDFTINLDGKSFAVHKLLLVASSNYFCEIIKDNQTSVDIGGIKAEIFETMLCYIYAEDVAVNESNIFELKENASLYELQGLVDMCMLFQDFVGAVTKIPEIKLDSLPEAKSAIGNKKPGETESMVHVRKSERQAKREAYNTISKTINLVEEPDDISTDDRFLPVTEENHVLPQKENIENHNRTHSVEVTKSQVEQIDNVSMLELQAASVPFVLKCEICHVELEDQKQRKAHMKKHFVQNQPNRFGCHLCMKAFRSASHLKRHMISHTGIRKHCCTTCGKLFLKSDHLKRHERTHTSERPFTCEQCGKQFRDKDHLKRHNLTHTEERPYFCEVCGKQFKDKSTLLSHQKSHNANNSVVCGVCGRLFKTIPRLDTHMVKHMETKAHICEICGKEFPFSGRLRKHMLSHTGARPFHCEICGKQFRDGHSLRQHQKKHTGIGLHPCLECGKKFTNAFHLKRHVKIHSGVKPYSCDVCKKSFARPDNLDSHRRSCIVNMQIKQKKCLPNAPLEAWETDNTDQAHESIPGCSNASFNVETTGHVSSVENLGDFSPQATTTTTHSQIPFTNIMETLQSQLNRSVQNDATSCSSSFTSLLSTLTPTFEGEPAINDQTTDQ
nr:myoneurin [Ciona intestinalis]|eukprot:XP_002120150.2 myoneurin [Ciona intestinalis]